MPTRGRSSSLHAKNTTYQHRSGLVKVARVWPDGERLRVFDAGCGDARLSRHLVTAGHQVSGIDASAEAVKVAKKRGVAATAGDVEGRWPVRASSQDVVLLLDVLEHTIDHATVLSEAKRVLRSGGRTSGRASGHLIICYPNHFDVRQRLAMLFGRGIVHWDRRREVPKAWEYGHLRFLRWQELRRLLEASGFTIEAVQFNFMGGGVLPRRALPPFARRWLTSRWPELLSGKFVVRAAVKRRGSRPATPQRIVLDKTAEGL